MCAGIVPLALMSGIGLRVLAQRHGVQTEPVGLEFARAVATAVDAELRSMHVPKPVDPGELTAIVGSVAARPPRASRP